MKGKQKVPPVHRPCSQTHGKDSEMLSISPASHFPEIHGFQLYLFLAQFCEVRHNSLYPSSQSTRNNQQPLQALQPNKNTCPNNFYLPFPAGNCVQLSQLVLWEFSLAMKLGSLLLLIIHKEIQPALHLNVMGHGRNGSLVPLCCFRISLIISTALEALFNSKHE